MLIHYKKFCLSIYKNCETEIISNKYLEKILPDFDKLNRYQNKIQYIF